MSTTLAIACPECDKQLNIRAELEGKKVRCKDCGHTFIVKAPPVKKPPAPKKTAPPPPKQGKEAAEDEYDNPNPYGVTAMELGHRCPHCAEEFESEDAIICVNCGYNIETREHLKTVKTFEKTGGDQFMWLLPGILSVVAIFVLIGVDIIWCFFLPDWVEDTGFPFEYLGYAPVVLWAVIASLFLMFFAGRFAVKRLIINPTAPEVEKR
jgi:DNA-directed RNA polymerase subunit RPC12/RpoP